MTSAADSPRPTWVRFRVLAWLCAVAVIANAQRSIMAVVDRPLTEDLELVANDLGDIKSAFFLGYAVLQIPAALVRDYFGTRATLATMAVLWSLGVAAMSATHGYDGLYATWLAVGALQAGVFACAVSAIRQWFSGRERIVASGWLAGCMSIGSAVATGLGGTILAGGASWQGLFVLFAIPGLVWGLGFGLLYRSRPEHHPGVNAVELAVIEAGNDARGESTDRIREPTPWWSILTSMTLWLLFMQQACRAACYVFFQTWFPEYLQQTKHVSLAGAGWLGSLPLLAVVAGAPLGGSFSNWLADRLGSMWWGRQGLAAGMLFSSAVLMLIAASIADATVAVAIITLGMLSFAIGGPTSYAAAIDLGGRHTSTVFSLMNMCGNLGGFLLPLLLPRFVAATSWDAALVLFAAIFLVGGFCWLGIRSKSPIPPAPQSA